MEKDQIERMVFYDKSSMRDYTEDFVHENGNYTCICSECKNSFFGHKRRTICKVCISKNEINHHFVWNGVHVNCSGNLTNEQLEALKKMIIKASEL